MGSVRDMLKVVDRVSALRAEAARPKVKRAPYCESLEGRQLMNAAWTPPAGGFGGWDGTPPSKGTSAQVRHFDATGSSAHAFPMAGAPRGARPDGTPPTAVAGTTPKAPSAALQTAFQTLQTDEKTLQSEIPSSLTSAVKTDQATIQKALSSLTSAQMQALRPTGTPGSTTSSDPSSNLTKALTEAGVSSSEISTITTDMQNLKNAYTTTDPTLQTKIAADEAAITKDGGPSMPPGTNGFGGPGMF